MRKEFAEFTISQVAVLVRDGKCLILQFSDNDLWGLPGGRIDEGELSWEDAFRREIREELGFTQFNILGLVDHDIWYSDFSGRMVCGVVRLIENKDEEIKLSHEHKQYKWVTADELDDYEYIWPRAVEMLKKGLDFNGRSKFTNNC